MTEEWEECSGRWRGREEKKGEREKKRDEKKQTGKQIQNTDKAEEEEKDRPWATVGRRGAEQRQLRPGREECVFRGRAGERRAVHHSPGILAIWDTQPRWMKCMECLEPWGHIHYLKSCGLLLIFFLNSNVQIQTHSMKDVFPISCK